MEKLEFRPRKVLLFFWLLWTGLGTFVGCCVLGGFCFGLVLDISLFYGLLILPVGFLVGVYCVLYFFSIHYSIDGRYVAKASGVLWKVRRSVPLEKITNIDVRQGPVERLLGFGRIWIFTPSTGGVSPEETLLGVDGPYEMKQTIIEGCESAKRTAGATAGAEAGESESTAVPVLKEILNTLRRIEEKLDDKKV